DLPLPAHHLQPQWAHFRHGYLRAALRGDGRSRRARELQTPLMAGARWHGGAALPAAQFLRHAGERTSTGLGRCAGWNDYVAPRSGLSLRYGTGSGSDLVFRFGRIRSDQAATAPCTVSVLQPALTD